MNYFLAYGKKENKHFSSGSVVKTLPPSAGLIPCRAKIVYAAWCVAKNFRRIKNLKKKEETISDIELFNSLLHNFG